MSDPQAAAVANSPARSPRFRFGLQGLMICVFGVAFGLAEFRREPGSINNGMLAALSAWAAVDLVLQARDLWRHFRGREDLGREQHWGVRFAIAWRIAAVTLWLGYYFVRECQNTGLLSLPERADSYVDVGLKLRTALLYLLLIVIAAPTRVARPARRSLFRRKVTWLTTLAAVGIAITLWWDQMTIPFLVHVACEGLAATTPLRFADGTMRMTQAERYVPFVRVSIAAVCVSFFNLFITWWLAVSWPRFRLPKIVLLAISAPILLGLEYWLATTGFPRASPFLAAAQHLGPPHLWPVAGLVVAILVTVWTFRLCALSWDGHHATNIQWRADKRYLHERMPWMALLAITPIWAIIQQVLNTYNVLGGLSWWLETIVSETLYEPLNMLRIALSMAACARIAGMLSRRGDTVSGIVALNPVQYGVVWLLLFVLIPPAIVAFVATSFAIWLTPWQSLLPPVWW